MNGIQLSSGGAGAVKDLQWQEPLKFLLSQTRDNCHDAPAVKNRMELSTCNFRMKVRIHQTTITMAAPAPNPPGFHPMLVCPRSLWTSKQRRRGEGGEEGAVAGLCARGDDALGPGPPSPHGRAFGWGGREPGGDAAAGCRRSQAHLDQVCQRGMYFLVSIYCNKVSNWISYRDQLFQVNSGFKQNITVQANTFVATGR